MHALLHYTSRKTRSTNYIGCFWQSGLACVASLFRALHGSWKRRIGRRKLAPFDAAAGVEPRDEPSPREGGKEDDEKAKNTEEEGEGGEVSLFSTTRVTCQVSSKRRVQWSMRR